MLQNHFFGHSEQLWVEFILKIFLWPQILQFWSKTFFVNQNCLFLILSNFLEKKCIWRDQRKTSRSGRKKKFFFKVVANDKKSLCPKRRLPATWLWTALPAPFDTHRIPGTLYFFCGTCAPCALCVRLPGHWPAAAVSKLCASLCWSSIRFDCFFPRFFHFELINWTVKTSLLANRPNCSAIYTPNFRISGRHDFRPITTATQTLVEAV